jgi:hypothetical protein
VYFQLILARFFWRIGASSSVFEGCRPSPQADFASFQTILIFKVCLDHVCARHQAEGALLAIAMEKETH